MQTSPNVRTGNGGGPPPVPPPLPPRQSRMTLGSVTRGRIQVPLRVLLYGVEGIGKSTFASNAPNPIFLCAEDGTTHLDVARLPEPKTWEEAFEGVRALANEKHDFKTLAVDTLDWLEPLCWDVICKRTSKTSVDEVGYGKGYNAALDEWRRFLAELESLRKKREMWIVLLAHAQVKTFKNPNGEDFDRYQLKLHDKAGGLVKEWCDAVLFANYETFTVEKEKNKRILGVSGARVIYTQRTAAWDAKNRHDLPQSIPLSFEDFAKGIAAHRPANPSKLRAEIEQLVADIGDAELATQVADTLKKAGDDAASLAKVKDRLAAKAAQKEG